MIDTHSHLNFKAFNEDRSSVLERSFSNGVEFIINVGSNLETSKGALKIAQEHQRCYAAIGIHPIHTNQLRDGWQKKIELLIKKKKAVALGETGLDYFRLSQQRSNGLSLLLRKGFNLKNIQQEIFLEHLQLAHKFNLPLILHCRDAFQDLFNILRDQSWVGKGVVHCFTGDTRQAKQFLDLGCYVGFTGLITFIKELEAVVKFVPLKKIVLETDCPYLAPLPYRGQRCEPWMVRLVAQKISQLKKKRVEEVITQTSKNAQRLFKL